MSGLSNTQYFKVKTEPQIRERSKKEKEAYNMRKRTLLSHIKAVKRLVLLTLILAAAFPATIRETKEIGRAHV